jgi:AraC family transcriptional regulator
MRKKNVHREAIARVLAYIDSYRDSNLNLEILSKIAHISKFHFHRVFKEYMGVSLGQYIMLKRLESGMWKLIYSEKKTLEIALDSGYEDHASFTRAFNKEMGCSPREFKENFNNYRKLTLHRMQKEAPMFASYKEVSKIEVYYIRKKGSYFLSAISAWDEIITDLANNNITANRETFYGIAQDDPNLMNIKKEELRYDVCIEVSTAVSKKEASLVATKGEISGGRFAVFRHKGPLERLSDSYHYLYGKWIFDNDVTLRDVRPFIKYINPFADVNEREAEIYLPVH